MQTKRAQSFQTNLEMLNRNIKPFYSRLCTVKQSQRFMCDFEGFWGFWKSAYEILWL